MLNSGKKIRALRDKKKQYSNYCVVRKKILNETKNHNPPSNFRGGAYRVHLPLDLPLSCTGNAKAKHKMTKRQITTNKTQHRQLNT
jgi:hypothetical protein